ncbi:phospholipid phosphatase 1 isoform X6 [Harpegnathos saltator]|uniref:phospholipid phosphatase 1 isoform X6 n=1 Tax=Harpegnathos saltator TaxID=610380 RepID=UPI000DBED96E|nr:phospholipid phosphatase 1 isoform X6 [Harpegnathos saltator]
MKELTEEDFQHCFEQWKIRMERCRDRRGVYIEVTIVLVVLEFGQIPHKKLGFFCNDPKISFKYTGDTISTSLLLCSAFIAPFIMMWIVECACYPADSYKNKLTYNSRWKHIWTWYRHCATVQVIVGVICECMKILIGEPRPHFLDTCKPHEAINCTNEYFEDYTCVSSSWFVMDASRSFPSGHTALSVCMAIFIIWYLQARLSTRFWFLKPWLQCLTCVWAVTCSVTRVSDHRHHWWDVTAGAILGILFGLYLVITLCRYFHINNTNNAVVDVKQVPGEVIAEHGLTSQISFTKN